MNKRVLLTDFLSYCLPDKSQSQIEREEIMLELFHDFLIQPTTLLGVLVHLRHFPSLTNPEISLIIEKKN